MGSKTLRDLKIQERETRKKLIADTARELFAKTEYQKVTVRQIARSAGVSVSTIYNYYSNVGELFLDILIENARRIALLMDKELEDDSPAVFRRVCQVYINYLNENIAFFQMMSRLILGSELSGQALPRLNESMSAVMDRFEKAVRIAGITTNTRLSAHLLFSALNGIMISYNRVQAENPEKLRQHTNRLTDMTALLFEIWDGQMPEQQYCPACSN